MKEYIVQFFKRRTYSDLLETIKVAAIVYFAISFEDIAMNYMSTDLSGVCSALYSIDESINRLIAAIQFK